MDNQQATKQDYLGASTTTRETPLSWLIEIFERKAIFSIDSQKRKKSIKYTPKISLESAPFEINKIKNILKGLKTPFYIWNERVIILGCKRVKSFLLITDKWTIRKVEILKSYCESRLSKGPKEPYTNQEHELAREIKMKI